MMEHLYGVNVPPTVVTDDAGTFTVGLVHVSKSVHNTPVRRARGARARARNRAIVTRALARDRSNSRGVG